MLCTVIFKLLQDHVKSLITFHFDSFGQGVLEHRIKLVHPIRYDAN
jgi:hypothetical protein